MMTTITAEVTGQHDTGEVVAGIDTHADTHHVAVIDRTGRRLADAGFPATFAGYQAILAYLTAFGAVRVIGIEGTHSYGAGITLHLQRAGLRVVEVLRPNRQVRRMRGKSDPIDAYEAAATALAGGDHPEPKVLDGPIEALRYLFAARRSAVKARSAAQVQVKCLLVTAPDRIRRRYREMGDSELLHALSRLRPAAEADQLSRTVLTALKSVARRQQNLTMEIDELETEMTALLDQAAPALHRSKGVGIITAAQLLITAGENSDRLHSEAAFAALCGASPIPASSGKTNRHRLNRGGDRQANSALHHIALSRISFDPRTQAYVARKRQAGKNTKEILRCLKRAIAREVYKLITNPGTVADYRTLRPLRHQLGLTQAQIATALTINPAKVSLIERGLAHDNECVRTYHQWLSQRI